MKISIIVTSEESTDNTIGFESSPDVSLNEFTRAIEAFTGELANQFGDYLQRRGYVQRGSREEMEQLAQKITFGELFENNKSDLTQPK